MKILKKLGAIVLSSVLALGIAGCGNKNTEKNNTENSKNIIVGVCPGPYGDMVKEVFTPLLEKKGYKVEVKEFSDYIQPDQALNTGQTHEIL